MSTPRDLVYRTLDFDGPERVPRQLWLLPWAEMHHPDAVARIRREFPDDIVHCPGFVANPPSTSGNPYEVGEYVDEWGAVFENKARGIIGEVKRPLVTEEEWEDADTVHIPRELLDIDVSRVNEFCRDSDRFVLAGACPRPFERLQFIRGTEQLYVDLMTRPAGLTDFMEEMHRYYTDLLTVWARTEVDALMMMDDWGAQHALLINPETWVELFKPLYAEYVDIAHSNGKKIFMHSDGHILAIYPHLVEIGVDALNSQLFCMGVENLSEYAGSITFWGEIDRQHLLPNATESEIADAVGSVKESLWKQGGCIAQCEFGAGANPDNVYAVYKAWSTIL